MRFYINGHSRPDGAGEFILTATVNDEVYTWKGPKGSPHRAAWKGAKEAVRLARAAGVRCFTIVTPNETVVKQATGRWSARKRVLEGHLRDFREMTRGMDVRWVLV